MRGAQNLEILFCARNLSGLVRFGAVRGDLCTSPPAGAVDLVVFHDWFPDGDSAGAALTRIRRRFSTARGAGSGSDG